jgi:hypothetical protein
MRMPYASWFYFAGDFENAFCLLNASTIRINTGYSFKISYGEDEYWIVKRLPIAVSTLIMNVRDNRPLNSFPTF